MCSSCSVLKSTFGLKSTLAFTSGLQLKSFFAGSKTPHDVSAMSPGLSWKTFLLGSSSETSYPGGGIKYPLCRFAMRTISKCWLFSPNGFFFQLKWRQWLRSSNQRWDLTFQTFMQRVIILAASKKGINHNWDKNQKSFGKNAFLLVIYARWIVQLIPEQKQKTFKRWKKDILMKYIVLKWSIRNAKYKKL